MDLAELLYRRSEEIISTTMEKMRRSHLRHYEDLGTGATRQLVARLYDLATECVTGRRIDPVLRFADEVAAERFGQGFDLFEVQTAFNVLEESIWKEVLTVLPAAEQARALGLVSTVLGMGKDALARRYLSLAGRFEVPSLDLKGLFSTAPAG